VVIRVIWVRYGATFLPQFILDSSYTGEKSDILKIKIYKIHTFTFEMHIVFVDIKYICMCQFIDAFIPNSVERRLLSCAYAKVVIM